MQWQLGDAASRCVCPGSTTAGRGSGNDLDVVCGDAASFAVGGHDRHHVDSDTVGAANAFRFFGDFASDPETRLVDHANPGIGAE